MLRDPERKIDFPLPYFRQSCRLAAGRVLPSRLHAASMLSFSR